LLLDFQAYILRAEVDKKFDIGRIKVWIYFFCLVMDYHLKKNDGNCIIARSAWCRVSVIFFSGDSSITKQNK
jgi:hypothetical protein